MRDRPPVQRYYGSRQSASASALAGVASTAGPVVGGWVTQHFSWRFIFWANLPLGIAALVLSQIGLSMLRETRPGGRIDFAGAALLTVAVAAGAIAIVAAIDEVFDVARRLIDSLETAAPPKNREDEAAKARSRAAERFGTQA